MYREKYLSALMKESKFKELSHDPLMEDFENFWNGNDPFMTLPAQKRMHTALDFKPNFQTKRHDGDDYFYLK